MNGPVLGQPAAVRASELYRQRAPVDRSVRVIRREVGMDIDPQAGRVNRELPEVEQTVDVAAEQHTPVLVVLADLGVAVKVPGLECGRGRGPSECTDLAVLIEKPASELSLAKSHPHRRARMSAAEALGSEVDESQRVAWDGGLNSRPKLEPSQRS
jgi:hypothetical protein